MENKLTVKDIKVRGQNILVRTDYNVPIKDGKITDDLRIRESLPTLEFLKKKGARRIIIISHLGRPGGQKDIKLSLAPVAERLKELIPDHKVKFIDDVSGPDVEEAVQKTPVGGILVLENLRFFRGEKENSAEFAREIAECTHASVFVQDGFAVIHRAHASTSAITTEMPSVAGLLLEKEITDLEKVSKNPKKPFLVIIGGAKVDDKQPLIDKFADIADNIAVGGRIAAEGYTTQLPNVYVAEDFSDGNKQDIGEKSTEKILDFVKNAKTVLWNGTLGKAEDEEFSKSSKKVAETIGRSNGITSVICGGDTTGFVENLMKTEKDLKYSLISTGGGAALEFLIGASLPGLEALDDK
ncbi:phosphoglycerate kinase [Candidatus Saccharibacteria bacterium]|nr:phosphoglycerate kinase [Candidatus Saccharibacteria bacterium]